MSQLTSETTSLTLVLPVYHRLSSLFIILESCRVVLCTSTKFQWSQAPPRHPLRSWHYAMTPPLQHQRPPCCPCCPCCLPGPPALRHQRWNSTNGCLLPAWNSSKGWSPCKWIENGSKMNQQIKVAWKNPCNKPNEKKPGMEGMFCNNRSGIHF